MLDLTSCLRSLLGPVLGLVFTIPSSFGLTSGLLSPPPPLPQPIWFQNTPAWIGLTLFRLGFCQPKKTEGPHNLAISSQKTMKLAKGILWVEIFTNWEKFLLTSSSCWFYDVIKTRQLKKIANFLAFWLNISTELTVQLIFTKLLSLWTCQLWGDISHTPPPPHHNFVVIAPMIMKFGTGITGNIIFCDLTVIM